MIISCPSCRTRYDLALDHLSADGSIIRCAGCGHSWLEGRAIEIEPVLARPALAALAVPLGGLEEEVRRIAEASRVAAARRKLARQRRRRVQRGWIVLAASVALPVTAAIAMPERVVSILPAAAGLYRHAGIAVNVRGFAIANVAQSNLVSDGTTVLAIRGEVTNISPAGRKVPALRFVLRDEAGVEIFGWTLGGVATKPLGPGETTSFITRIASPPLRAKSVEIRFARPHEIGSNT